MIQYLHKGFRKAFFRLMLIFFVDSYRTCKIFINQTSNLKLRSENFSFYRISKKSFRTNLKWRKENLHTTENRGYCPLSITVTIVLVCV